MKLYLIRHAETQENIDRIVQGWMNTKLTNKGKKKAKEIAKKFNEDIVAIYTSDLKRCTETAKPFVNKYPTIIYEEDQRLRERNLGDAQGSIWTKSQWKMYWNRGEIDKPIINSESREEVTKRVKDFIDWVVSNHDNDSSCLIVTHGGVISRILEITNSESEHSSFVNGAITRIEI